jgi:GGDEF domain-containing protein
MSKPDLEATIEAQAEEIEKLKKEMNTSKYLLGGFQDLTLHLAAIDPELDRPGTINKVEKVCTAEFGGQAKYVSHEEQRDVFEGLDVPLTPLLNSSETSDPSIVSFIRGHGTTLYVPLSNRQGTLILENVNQEFVDLEDGKINPILQYLSTHVSSDLRKKVALEESVIEANVDDLTGLLNRKAFDGIYATLCEKAKKESQPISVILLDVDNFKTYNDTYGHQKGDQVLTAIGAIIRDTVRAKDLGSIVRGRVLEPNGGVQLDLYRAKRGARYGGEEFIIPLLGATREAAANVAERLRRNMAEYDFAAIGGRNTVTASIGVAGTPNDGFPMNNLIVCADQRLYQAKKAGRNRVVYATPCQASS